MDRIGLDLIERVRLTAVSNSKNKFVDNRKARLALREQLIILWKQIGLPFNEGISSFKADDLFRDE